MPSGFPFKPGDLTTELLAPSIGRCWWQLIILIPIIGVIVLIVFLVQDSREANDYGANPKAAVPG